MNVTVVEKQVCINSDGLTVNLCPVAKELLVLQNLLAELCVARGQDVMHTLNAALAGLTVSGQHVWTR